MEASAQRATAGGFITSHSTTCREKCLPKQLWALAAVLAEEAGPEQRHRPGKRQHAAKPYTFPTSASLMLQAHHPTLGRHSGPGVYAVGWNRQRMLRTCRKTPVSRHRLLERPRASRQEQHGVCMCKTTGAHTQLPQPLTPVRAWCAWLQSSPYMKAAPDINKNSCCADIHTHTHHSLPRLNYSHRRQGARMQHKHHPTDTHGRPAGGRQHTPAHSRLPKATHRLFA